MWTWNKHVSELVWLNKKIIKGPNNYNSWNSWVKNCEEALARNAGHTCTCTTCVPAMDVHVYAHTHAQTYVLSFMRKRKIWHSVLSLKKIKF